MTFKPIHFTCSLSEDAYFNAELPQPVYPRYKFHTIDATSPAGPHAKIGSAAWKRLAPQAPAQSQ